MIKRNGEDYKKNINVAQIKVSWIKEPDQSHSLSDICVENNGKGEKIAIFLFNVYPFDHFF